MIWNSAGPNEYPNVQEFALKKKLALMAAHDSIIGAQVTVSSRYIGPSKIITHTAGPEF